MNLLAIHSGGQTGADRAALDAAMRLGFPLGGWVPAGRLAEDGRIPDSYPGLRETQESDVAVRTRLNVAAADAVLCISRGGAKGGTLLALQAAKTLRKPCFHLDLSEHGGIERVATWLDGVEGHILNVAGPRESEDPGIYEPVFRLVTGLVLSHGGNA